MEKVVVKFISITHDLCQVHHPAPQERDDLELEDYDDDDDDSEEAETVEGKY